MAKLRARVTEMEVSYIRLVAETGLHMRWTTLVVRGDGKRVVFMDRLSKKAAMAQAANLPEHAWEEPEEE